MDKEATPDGAIRIGVAHGSIQGFGSEGEASNYVARADDAGLSYLAMGDWHRQMKINERVWYSGTPEPDQFKLRPNAVTSLCNGGAALLVEVNSPRMVPAVLPIATGRYQWHRVEKTLTDDTQMDPLESELRSLHPDLSKMAAIAEFSMIARIPSAAVFRSASLPTYVLAKWRVGRVSSPLGISAANSL